jgi:hypothetical protein
MELGDLFDRDHRRGSHGHREHDSDHGNQRGRYREHDDHLDDRDHHESGGRWQSQGDRHQGHHGDDGFDFPQLGHRLLANKKLLVLAGFVLVPVLVVVAIFALPLLGQLLAYIDKNGLQGVLDRILKGSGG